MKRHVTNLVGRTPLIARSTLSSTVSFGNRLVIWNVRAMPSAVRRWLGQPVTSFPNNRTCPDVAGRIPVTTLNSVVFPAPFGPMIALRSPRKIFRLTSRTACRPPKLLHRPLSSRTGSFSPADCFTLDPLLEKGRRGARAPASRSEEHTSELQSLRHLVCRLLLEKKN